MLDLRRRDFITLLGGASVAWPLRGARPAACENAAHRSAHAPSAQTMRKQAGLAAFLQGLQEAGWAVGRSVRIDFRWFAGNIDDIRRYAADWSRSCRTVIE